MIRAEIELGGQLEVVLIEAESKSKAIEKIWDTYGYMTYIVGLEEVVDGETDSNEPIDVDESAGTSGDTEGDVLQANE